MAARSCATCRLPRDYIAVHTGYVPEYDYDLDTHRRWFTPKVKPLDLAKVAKRNMFNAKLAIGTGINEGNIREVMTLDPEIIMVGRAIFDTDDRVMAAERMRRYLPFEG